MEAEGNSSSALDEMVHLAVPRRHYPMMVQALAQMMQAENMKGTKPMTSMSPQAQEAPTIPVLPWPTEGEEPAREIDWTVENCRRLRSWLRNQAALTLLDMAADKAGTSDPRVYLEEVMTRCNCSHGTASAGNGALTKAIRKVFGFKGKWPAPFQWDVEKQLAYYVMLPEVAMAWKASSRP